MEETDSANKWKRMLELHESSSPAGDYFREKEQELADGSFATTINPTDRVAVNNFYEQAVASFTVPQ